MKNDIYYQPEFISSKEFLLKLIRYLILIACLLPLLAMGQVPQDWLVLDERMECTITKVARQLTMDDQHQAARYNEFDLSLVDPALAWDWNITNPMTGDFDHWVKGATFKNETLANVWWEAKGLHENYYKQDQGLINWDVKDTIRIEGELVVIKYYGFDDFAVEGTIWLKKGRFIFEIGNITRTTKELLVDSTLIPAMRWIIVYAKSCDLFEGINEGVKFVFDPEYFPNGKYYVCYSPIPRAFITNVDDIYDDIEITLLRDGLPIYTWDQKSSLCEQTPGSSEFVSCVKIDLDKNISPGSTIENAQLKLRYLESIEISPVFNIYPLCTVKFSYSPEEIAYNEKFTLYVDVTNHFPELEKCEAVRYQELFTETEGSVDKTSHSIDFTCPGPNSLGNYDGLYFVIHSCYWPDEKFYEDGIFIPIVDADIPENTLDDVYIFGGPDDDYGASIAAGADPTEIFVTGQVAGTALLGEYDFITDGAQDAFKGKWNYLLNKWEWIQPFGSPTGVDRSVKVVIDSATTELNYTMISSDDVNIGAQITVETGSGNSVVHTQMKINGEIKWVVTSNAIENKSVNYNHRPLDMTRDGFGNVYITGYFHNEIQFIGTDGLTQWSATGSTTDDNLFLVKISDTGEILWGFNASGNDDVKGRKLITDSGGNVYLAASYDESVILPGFTFNDDRGAFLAKFNMSGNIDWLMDIKESCYINGLVLDKEEEHLFICGRARDDADFGGYIWQGNDDFYSRLFFGKVSIDGQTEWIKHGSSSVGFDGHWPLDMAIDSENILYMTGYMQDGDLILDDLRFTPENWDPRNKIIFVIAFDENGEVLWGDTAADNPPGEEDMGEDEATSITVDARDNIYIAGTVRGNPGFGDETIQGVGANDIFIARVYPGLITAIDKLDQHSDDELLLFQNYPNPFSRTSTISFNLLKKSDVRLDIYDVKGALMSTFLLNDQQAGLHKVLIDAGEWVPGLYFYKIRIKDRIAVKRMVVMK